jgi:hypothetical protein
VREKNGGGQSHLTPERKERIADTAAFPLNSKTKGRQRNTGSRTSGRAACLPLVGAPTDLAIRNKTQNQNLPKKENPNTSGTLEGLPLVGIESSKRSQKEAPPNRPRPIQSHDHFFDWKMLIKGTPLFVR